MASAIRLTTFVTTFETGGTERQFLNLTLGLHARGVDVRFGCLRRDGRLRAELDARGIPVREYAMHSFYSRRFFTQQVALARDLSRGGTDVLQAYNLYGNVFAIPAARLARVPLVVAGIRDCGVYLTPRTRRVQRAVCRWAHLIIVNAQGIKDWLVGDGYRPDNIEVIRNGVDLSRFLAPPAIDPAAVRREFGVPAGAPLLSIVSRLCPSKGLDDLIDAMPVVRRRHPEARLLIVGEQLVSRDGSLKPSDEYRSRLTARAESLGVADRVIFAGHRTDVPAIQHAVDLAVHPSRTEGLSNSVLEALASGAAVLATPVGGMPEIIEHDRTGWLVPPHAPQQLGEAIATLLDQPPRRRRLGEAGRALVRDTFSIDRMVQATEEVYREHLQRRRTRARRTGHARVMAAE